MCIDPETINIGFFIKNTNFLLDDGCYQPTCFCHSIKAGVGSENSAIIALSFLKATLIPLMDIHFEMLLPKKEGQILRNKWNMFVFPTSIML